MKKIKENRSYHNMTGNFIHPFDKKTNPILPSPHMATQLSVELPPVEDPEYIPSTHAELKASAQRISNEVPPEQVEFFYKGLHKLLDLAIDRAQADEASEGWLMERKNMLKESMSDKKYAEAVSEMAKKYIAKEGDMIKYLSFETYDVEKYVQVLLKKVGGILKAQEMDKDQARTQLDSDLRAEIDKIAKGITDTSPKEKEKGTKVAGAGAFDDSYLDPKIKARKAERLAARFKPDQEIQDDWDKAYEAGYKAASLLDNDEEDVIIPDEWANDAALSSAFDKGIADARSEQDLKITPKSYDVEESNEDFSRMGRRVQGWKKQGELLRTLRKILQNGPKNPQEESILAELKPISFVKRIAAPIVRGALADVSRVIGNEAAVSYKISLEVGGKPDFSSVESDSWGYYTHDGKVKKLLYNKVNANDEVLYLLPKDFKTKEYWYPVCYHFIKKFMEGKGNAPIVKSFVGDMINLIDVAELVLRKTIPKATKETAIKMIASEVASMIVVEANTRNVPKEDSEYLYGAPTDPKLENLPIYKKKAGVTQKIFAEVITLKYFRDLVAKGIIEKDISRSEWFANNAPPRDMMVPYMGSQETFYEVLVDMMHRVFYKNSEEHARRRQRIGKNTPDNDDKAARVFALSWKEHLDQDDEFMTFDEQGKVFKFRTDEVIQAIDQYLEEMYTQVDQRNEAAQEAEEESIESAESAGDDFSKTEELFFKGDDEKTVKRKDAAGALLFKFFTANGQPAESSARNYVFHILNKKQRVGSTMKDDDLSKMSENLYSTIDDAVMELHEPVTAVVQNILVDANKQLKKAQTSAEKLRLQKIIIICMKAKVDLENLATISEETEDIFGTVEYWNDKAQTELRTINGADVLNKTPGGAILKYIYGNLLSDVFGMEKRPTAFGGKITPFYKSFEKQLIAIITDYFKQEGAGDLVKAQKASHRTAEMIYHNADKATFIEPTKRGKNGEIIIQPKMAWAFQGRVKNELNFSERNQKEMTGLTKNFVCWFSGIAEAEFGPKATLEQRFAVAQRAYEDLSQFADKMFEDHFQTAFSTKKKNIQDSGQYRDYIMSQIDEMTSSEASMKAVVMEAISDYIDLLEMSPEKLRNIVKNMQFGR